ncbi:MAG TPA: flavin reductase family protein [Candidatus Dormibacteraeota bacterium]|jgi:flavin reductase (DIM6/NTAB) family NADH-FMN oxidoreductase RutF|nr:flavin reductase family protein [Candidatus Dormibacteraeota bacterium]
MSLDPAAFRVACGNFATGVAIVTMRTADGAPHGFTANSFTSVSLDPPLLLVCVDREISSYEVIGAAAGWLVNILSDGQEELSRRFATPDIDKFVGVEFSEGPFGAPKLPGCIAYLAARGHAAHDGGDHGIFVGEAVEAEVAGGRPLIFFRGQYGL